MCIRKRKTLLLIFLVMLIKKTLALIINYFINLITSVFKCIPCRIILHFNQLFVYLKFIDCERSLLSVGLDFQACKMKGGTADNTSRNEKYVLPTQHISRSSLSTVKSMSIYLVGFQQKMYPNIFNIALKYLSPPSSSVYLERVVQCFSWEHFH